MYAAVMSSQWWRSILNSPSKSCLCLHLFKAVVCWTFTSWKKCGVGIWIDVIKINQKVFWLRGGGAHLPPVCPPTLGSLPSGPPILRLSAEIRARSDSAPSPSHSLPSPSAFLSWLLRNMYLQWLMVLIVLALWESSHFLTVYVSF